jgi:hypothetical protein
MLLRFDSCGYAETCRNILRQAHFGERQQEGQSRFRALVGIDPIRV